MDEPQPIDFKDAQKRVAKEVAENSGVREGIHAAIALAIYENTDDGIVAANEIADVVMFKLFGVKK